MQAMFLRTLDSLLKNGSTRVNASDVARAMNREPTSTVVWWRDNLISLGLVESTGSGSGTSLTITDNGRAYLANAR